jgi:hypothetical protein
MIPVGVLVLGVVHHYVAVADQIVHSCWVTKVSLFSEMLCQILFCGDGVDGAVVEELPCLEDEGHLMRSFYHSADSPV